MFPWAYEKLEEQYKDKHLDEQKGGLFGSMGIKMKTQMKITKKDKKKKKGSKEEKTIQGVHCYGILNY